MDNIPDNYSLWEAHDRDMALAEENAEKCAWCGGTLWNSYYEISGDYVCEDCIDGCRRYM